MEQKTLSRATGENYRKNPQKTEETKFVGLHLCLKKYTRWATECETQMESKSDKTQCHAQEYKVLSRLLV